MDEVEPRAVNRPGFARVPMRFEFGDPVAHEQTRVIESEGVTHLRYRVVR
jgi:hypothetical protein